MRKKLSILLILCLAVTMLVSCGNKEEETVEEPTTEITASADSENAQSEASDPAVIKALDSYEELSNQYIQIATKYFRAAEKGKKKKMKSFEADYNSMKKQFDEKNKEIDAIDYSGLCASDASYYDEVTTRVTNNVASMLEKHANAVQMIMEMNAN